MKRLIAVLMITTTLSSFTTTSEVSENSRIHSSKKLGLEIIRAVADQSESDFLALLPSVSDFHAIMNANAVFYGGNIAEAQKEFSSVYTAQVVPQAKKAFAKLIQEGKKHRIDWRTIEVAGIDTATEPGGTLSFVSVSINFLSSGNPYRLIVDKSLVWNGQWKVSQHIRLTKG